MNIHESILPRISVNRPVMVTMVLLALLVLGGVAYDRIPIKLMPSGLDPNFLFVNIRYNNSTPQESESQITRPLEETLRAVKGIERLRTSSDERGTRARISFREDTDMALAYNQVVDRLDRLKPSLPVESRDRVRVYKWDMDSWSILWGGVTLDPSIGDPYQYCQRTIVRALERIDGVGAVDLYGVNEKEVMVEIDQERLQSRGLSLAEVVRALQGDNFALAGGFVQEGEKKLHVRSVAKYRSLDEIQGIKIPGREGLPEVSLKDVATVSYDVPTRRSYQRLNGELGISFGVKQESGANIVETTARVRDVLGELEKSNAGLQFNVFFDQGMFILNGRQESPDDRWMGRPVCRLDSALLPAHGQDDVDHHAVDSALFDDHADGHSLHRMVAERGDDDGVDGGVGMVVDNAIVILENISRFRGRMSAREGAIKGASEVGLAITMATLTTVVVFLPLMLMGGKNQAMNFYLTRMGVPVVFALLASLFVALIFIPLASVRFGGTENKPDPVYVRRTREVYGRVLAWTMRHRRDAALIALVLFTTISIPSSGLKRSDRGGRALNDFRVSMQMPPHFTFEQTVSVIDGVEAFLDEHRARFDIQTVRTYYRERYANTQVFLVSRANETWYWVAFKNATAAIGFPVSKEMDRKEVVKAVRDEIPQYVGSITVSMDGMTGVEIRTSGWSCRARIRGFFRVWCPRWCAGSGRSRRS